MNKSSSVKVRKTSTELSSFVSKQELLDALEKATTNKSLLRKAMTDPKKFLSGEGVKVPARADVKISRGRTTLSGQITICIQVCRQIGRIVVCVQVCITIVFQT